MVDCSDTPCDFKLSVWKENRDKAFDHHVVEFGLLLVELHYTASWDNGKVIGDFSVIKDALIELNAVFFNCIGCPIRNWVF